MTPDEEQQLNQVVQTMLKSVTFSNAPMRKTLFNLLWQKLDTKTKGKTIWKTLWPDDEEQNKYDDPKQDVRRQCRSNVRQQCSALSKALDDYFNKTKHEKWETTSPWVVGLKRGGPARGYQLECKKTHDAHSLTRAFWEAHLDSDRAISLIYIEHRFFLDESKGLVFRYYDCNEEQNSLALAELEKLHPTHGEIKHLIPLHPYVAIGEINARDLIARWFRERGLEEIECFASRTVSDKASVWEDSQILFGSASSNRFVLKVLNRYPNLPIQRLTRTKFMVAKVSKEPFAAEEAARLERGYLDGQCHLKINDADYILNFNPKTKIAPVLLTRVPNPDGTHAAVTIFDSERGKTVEQIAAVLTDDKLMQQTLQRCGIVPPFPDAFQILCAVSMRSHEREVYPLVWRPLGRKVLIPSRLMPASNLQDHGGD